MEMELSILQFLTIFLRFSSYFLVYLKRILKEF
nr:MAG TPA: hypothetical protein [Caudoviricetes sp.]